MPNSRLNEKEERTTDLMNICRMRQAAPKAALFAAAALFSLGVCDLRAQSDATATQPLALSAFGAGTGNWTNLLGGRNGSITAGADLSFLTYRRFRPVLELRGTYPIKSGHVDDQRSFLGGVRIERELGPFHPYVNFLIGRGAINYLNGGYFLNNVIYLRTVSTVYSPGLGVDYDVTPHWAVKADFQYQHWDTPVGPGGVINPRLLSLGAVYRFDFNHHYRVRRERR